ncbi:hypothetical protein N8613_05270, partial [Verrucomicrobia bacterium]|nr:hypothetical protein [Verrucomicrobiota bacterium]
DRVVKIIEENTGEVIYTTRSHKGSIRPKVFSNSKHTVKFGNNLPDEITLTQVQPLPIKSSLNGDHLIEI